MLLVLGPWNVLYANIQIVENCMERRLHYPQNQLPLNSYRELHMRQSPYFIHNQESVQRQIEGGVLFLLLFIRGSNRWGALTRDHGHGGFKQEIDILSTVLKVWNPGSTGSCSLWSSSEESGLASSWFLVVAKQLAVLLGFCHLVSTCIFKWPSSLCVSVSVCLNLHLFSYEDISLWI